MYNFYKQCASKLTIDVVAKGMLTLMVSLTIGSIMLVLCTLWMTEPIYFAGFELSLLHQRIILMAVAVMFITDLVMDWWER